MGVGEGGSRGPREAKALGLLEGGHGRRGGRHAVRLDVVVVIVGSEAVVDVYVFASLAWRFSISFLIFHQK